MPSDKPVVHVIDDDEAMRESLAFLLSAVGLEVRTYESALGFLDVAPNAEAGCVITDVRMPGLSGVDLLRRLRELKLGIPVIVITGHGDVPLAVEAMKIGALDFLEKPPLMMKCCWHRCDRRSTSWTMQPSGGAAAPHRRVR